MGGRCWPWRTSGAVLYQVATVELPVVADDLAQRGPMAGGEVLAILNQRPTGVLNLAALPGPQPGGEAAPRIPPSVAHFTL